MRNLLTDSMQRPLSDSEQQTIQKEVTLWLESIKISHKPQAVIGELISSLQSWAGKYLRKMSDSCYLLEKSPLQHADKVKVEFKNIVKDSMRDIYFIEQLSAQIKLAKSPNVSYIEQSNFGTLDELLNHANRSQRELNEVISTTMKSYHLVDKKYIPTPVKKDKSPALDLSQDILFNVL